MATLLTYTKAAIDALISGRAPSIHTHSSADVTGLDAALAGKASASHTHAAGDLVSGTVSTARLGSGSASSSTYLRGDGSWNTPPGIPATLVDAKGDLLVGTAVDTVARMPVGTNGFILKADSTNANGMVWSQDLSVSVNWFDAKGDLIVGSANNTSTTLSVGTNGQVLTADSTQTGGMKWAAPGSATYLRSPVILVNPDLGNDKPQFVTNAPLGCTMGTGYSCKENSTAVALPISIPADITVTKVALEVTTANAGGTVRAGIFNVDADGTITTVVLDTGAIATDTTGVKEFTPGSAVVIPKGNYAVVGWSSSQTQRVRGFKYTDYILGITGGTGDNFPSQFSMGANSLTSWQTDYSGQNWSRNDFGTSVVPFLAMTVSAVA